MPTALRSLTMTKEGAAVTIAAYAALAERTDVLSPEGRTVLADLVTRVNAMFDTFPGHTGVLTQAQAEHRDTVIAKLTPQTHDPKACVFCANDAEQCHYSLDCEARAWANLFCGPHQPDPRSYR